MDGLENLSTSGPKTFEEALDMLQTGGMDTVWMRGLPVKVLEFGGNLTEETCNDKDCG